jgi:hypothetical protein
MLGSSRHSNPWLSAIARIVYQRSRPARPGPRRVGGQTCTGAAPSWKLSVDRSAALGQSDQAFGLIVEQQSEGGVAAAVHQLWGRRKGKWMGPAGSFSPPRRGQPAPLVGGGVFGHQLMGLGIGALGGRVVSSGTSARLPSRGRTRPGEESSPGWRPSRVSKASAGRPSSINSRARG